MSSPPVVTVLASRFVRGGCCTLEAAPTALADALERRWPSDAHMQAAVSPVRRHSRLVTADVGRVPIEIHVIAFDVDAPQHRWDDAWWADECLKIAAVSEVHPNPFVFTTRGGYRVCWVLAETYRIQGLDDAAAWPFRYRAACDVLAAFDIQADRGCCDPMRLHRLPYVVRDGKPTAPEIIGDARRIGTFVLPPMVETRTQRVNVLHCRETASDFLLLRLLRCNDDVLGARSDGSYLIRCPRRRLHSVGRDGDGSTVLFPPEGFGYGKIHCLHQSCVEATIDDWLAALGTHTTPTLGHRENAEDIPASFHEVTITGAYINGTESGINVNIHTEPRIGGLRVHASNASRWAALWDAVGIEPPRDMDPRGDLGDAVGELAGKRAVLEVSRGRIRRILPASAQKNSLDVARSRALPVEAP